MPRVIQPLPPARREEALDFIEKVFTEHQDAAEGRTVRNLAAEIRAKRYHLPELELIMVDDSDEIIGYAMFSRFPLEGRCDDALLLLSPVAVRTDLQRQHISKDLIEYGMARARALGYRAVLVEGAPWNYRSRGFETSARHGITAGPNLHLPHEDCLMVAELVPGALDSIHGIVDYGMYDALQ